MNEPAAPATLVLVALTAYCSWRGFRRPDFRDRFLFNPADVLGRRQYWRLATSGLLHADWTHLLLNMVSLYLFGREVEAVLGAPSFLAVYLAGIVGGNALALVLHRHEEYRALGASGGVCGVIFAAIFLLPGGRICIFPLPVGIPVFVYAVVFLVVSFWGARSGRGNIGHDAHLGGAIAGLMAATAIRPSIPNANPLLFAAVLGTSALAFLYLYRRSTRPAGPAPSARAAVRKAWSEARARRQGRKRAAEEQALDRLLRKIAASGLDSLTRAEREQLKDITRHRSAEDDGPGRE